MLDVNTSINLNWNLNSSIKPAADPPISYKPPTLGVDTSVNASALTAAELSKKEKVSLVPMTKATKTALKDTFENVFVGFSD